MRKAGLEFNELRFRIKLFLGLVMLGAFLGAIAWVWQDLGGEGDAVNIARAFWWSRGDWRFWSVMGCCGALGGWLAFMLTRSRVQRTEDQGGGGGWQGPSL